MVLVLQQLVYAVTAKVDTSSLKWNSLCEVLRHNPYVIHIEFGAKFARTIAVTRYSPRRPLDLQHRKNYFCGLVFLTQRALFQ